MEAAELMEHTQWAKDAELPALASERRDALAEEMADIAILLTYLAHDLHVDLETAVRQKLVKNAAKYPVEKAKGAATKGHRLAGSVVPRRCLLLFDHRCVLMKEPGEALHKGKERKCRYPNEEQRE